MKYNAQFQRSGLYLNEQIQRVASPKLIIIYLLFFPSRFCYFYMFIVYVLV